MDIEEYKMSLYSFDMADRVSGNNDMSPNARLQRFICFVAKRKRFFDALYETINKKMVVLNIECATLEEYITESLSSEINSFFKLDIDLP